MEYCTLKNAKRSVIFKYVIGILSGICTLISLGMIISMLHSGTNYLYSQYHSVFISRTSFYCDLAGNICSLIANILICIYIWALYGKKRSKLLALAALFLGACKVALVIYPFRRLTDICYLESSILEYTVHITIAVIAVLLLFLFILLLLPPKKTFRAAKITVVIILCCVFFHSMLSIEYTGELYENDLKNYFYSSTITDHRGNVPIVGSRTLYSENYYRNLTLLSFLNGVLLYLPLCFYILFCDPNYMKKYCRIKQNETAEELSYHLQFLKMQLDDGTLSEEEYEQQRKEIPNEL
ncbi:MAG: SHOCT domain-containing protein [Clostridia bacterium]